jgi:type III secretion protein J
MTMKALPAARRLALVLLVLLAGCNSQELYSQLSERQANEMVAVLRSAGIKAEKQSAEGRFSVLTAPGDFPAAVRTLSAQGYPREQFDSMGKVFKREGFVSTPLEERARLVYSMSQEISNTINNIDGVVTARVHLVVPERNPLVDKPQPAAAAVFIKHRPDRNLSAQIPQIKALVVNSIEGLPYDNVTVALFPAESIPDGKPAPMMVEPQRRPVGVPLLAGTAGMVFVLGGGFVWWRRRAASAAAPATKAPAAKASTRANLPAEIQAALRRAEAKR